ncbi:MAG TPA: PIN domain-containing protein [Gemmataceae bacterium]|nr:PIN domain-containing protein [Gemmataceae bacterium]
MGALTLPTSGLVYLDANPIIYTVEKHPVYGPLLQPLWQAVQARTIEVISSELALMETLVGPLKSGNTTLELQYEQALLGTDMRLIPITQAILREAARLRATTKLKTPDALHAATAQQAGCVLFITNDAGFRGVASLPLVILDDLLTP